LTVTNARFNQGSGMTNQVNQGHSASKPR
jgi:hypothetical protein